MHRKRAALFAGCGLDSLGSHKDASIGAALGYRFAIAGLRPAPRGPAGTARMRVDRWARVGGSEAGVLIPRSPDCLVALYFEGGQAAVQDQEQIVDGGLHGGVGGGR